MSARACLYFIVLLAACSDPVVKQVSIDSLKQEIINAEHAFCKTAQEKGIAEAFYLFADSNAIVKTQNDSIIHGPEDIRTAYANSQYSGASMTWEPDYVDVSNDGTLGWTYGHFESVLTDSTGREERFSGLYHTVWRKQKDGSWKYVWD